MTYSPDKTALILIGYQNDFFDAKGALHGVIGQHLTENRVLENTLRLIDALKDTEVHIINTPILFSEDYSELHDPSGLMATIKEVGAFRRDAWGGEVCPEITAYGDRIEQFQGKTRFNGFYGTSLHDFLKGKDIDQLIVAGVVTSLCVDSTSRAASDLGYSVTVLTDCTGARTVEEQEFYCESIFPLYAGTTSVDGILEQLQLTAIA